MKTVSTFYLLLNSKSKKWLLRLRFFILSYLGIGVVRPKKFGPGGRAQLITLHLRERVSNKRADTASFKIELQDLRVILRLTNVRFKFRFKLFPEGDLPTGEQRCSSDVALFLARSLPYPV